MTCLRAGSGALRGAGPAVFVSPHLDDGVMSCGCLIAALARRRRVTVVTVFAGRPRDGAPCAWDIDSGFASGADAIGARRAEDRAALAILGARPRWLPFRDSQYGDSPRTAAVVRALARVPALLEERSIVAFPLGLFHSDHRQVREAMLALLRRQPWRSLWLAYEDALYRRLPGQRDGALERLRRAGYAPRPARAARDAVAENRKARAIVRYRSQLRALATPGRLGHTDALAAEGYWRLDGPRRCRGSAAA
jgi:LmbE family N-acetylglucosaminyl deacetylase